MRATMGTIHRNILNNLNKINEKMNLLNAQISSGRQMSRPSDDPVNLAGVLGLRTTQEELKQYQRNLQFGDNFIRSSESALRQINDLAVRAKELAIQAANDVLTPGDRANMAKEVRNLFEQAIVLANTQVNGKFIFGGFRTSGYSKAEPAPFLEGFDTAFRVNGSEPAGAFALDAGELRINGIAVGAAADSAAAKAEAINAVAGATGVQAKANPASRLASGPVMAGPAASGDLTINGVDIFPAAVMITDGDRDNTLVTAINLKQGETGVTASRDASGRLLLAAADGRNIRIQTTAAGEAVTRLNNQDGTAADQTYYGTLQLFSVRSFTLESTTDPAEQALAALGLAGGGFQTDDAAGDGLLAVHEIARREGSVRYVGDPDHDLEVKVGARSTLPVSKNGQDALMDTGVFSVLKQLENHLLGKDYTGFRSSLPAKDLAVPLASGGTGLREENRITQGQFTVTITDHEQSPPVEFAISIGIDPDHDSLEDIAARINNLPGLTAGWDAEGYLSIEVTDRERYSVALTDDSSNFLQAAGLTGGNMQFASLERSIADLEPLMNRLINYISDFGARGNRIDAQGEILGNLELAVAENLSQKEDTDMLKAFMELKTKEIAYQSALSAAAKTMQLSLVNYL